MRIVFMGTPEFAVPTLDALVAAGHQVAAVYSQPPRPGGRRGRELTPSPVQQRAEALGLAVRTPVSLKGAEEQAAFAALGADVGVVAAYGLILPRAVLGAARHGCLNVHGSLLPRWRGAAPVQRAILAGDAETGVGIMQMKAGLDTGPVRLEGRTPVDGKTAGELTGELAAIGARLMVEVLADLDRYTPVPQSEDGVTYATKIDKAEARIDWTRSAVEIERLVRAMNPAPGAWFEVDRERIKILHASAIDRWPEAHTNPGTILDVLNARTSAGKVDRPRASFVVECGEGYLRPNLLQRAGKPPMPALAFTPGFVRQFGRIIA